MSCLQPPGHLAGIIGLAQPFEQRHVFASPSAASVKLHPNPIRGLHAGVGRANRAEGAAEGGDVVLPQLRAAELQDHLRVVGGLFEAHASRDAISRRWIAHPLVVAGVGKFCDVLAYVLQEQRLAVGRLPILMAGIESIKSAQKIRRPSSWSACVRRSNNFSKISSYPGSPS